MAKKNEPKTWSEAEALMSQFAQGENELTKLRAAHQEAIQFACESYDAQAKPYLAKRGELEKALKKFAGAHKAEFKPRAEGGDVRSYDHAGAQIGFRKQPDKADIPPGQYDEIVSGLEEYGDAYVRTRKTPNIEAILETLKNGHPKDQKFLAGLGIALKPGKDKFFVEVLGK